MKKQIFLFMAFAAFLLAGCNDDSSTTIALDEVPAEIQTYVSANFSEQTIKHAVLEEDDGRSTYKLYLDDFTKLEFNSAKEITEIEGSSKLPDSVIPEAILTYVNASYAGNHILAWELENAHQQVKLNNSLELEFDLNGNFLRID